MTNSNEIILGYDLDDWHEMGKKTPIGTGITKTINSHILLIGVSGSGKTVGELQIMTRLIMNEESGQYYFADYKQDDSFEHIRGCPRYYPYKRTMEALDIVYDILQKRQSGEDKSRTPVTLLYDEYVASILALLAKGTDGKKKAGEVMNKISEILMLGRSLAIRLLIASQRPDATVFPAGSRQNFGIIVLLGAAMRSTLEMIMPKEYVDRICERQFGQGEGIALLQGTELRFIKLPTIQDMTKIHEITKRALSED